MEEQVQAEQIQTEQVMTEQKTEEPIQTEQISTQPEPDEPVQTAFPDYPALRQHRPLCAGAGRTGTGRISGFPGMGDQREVDS